jgi:hypothetical protein
MKQSLSNMIPPMSYVTGFHKLSQVAVLHCASSIHALMPPILCTQRRSNAQYQENVAVHSSYVGHLLILLNFSLPYITPITHPFPSALFLLFPLDPPLLSLQS